MTAEVMISVAVAVALGCVLGPVLWVLSLCGGKV